MRLRNKKGRTPICKCGKMKERPTQGYCNGCKNKWARVKRKRHNQLDDLHRQRANARSYLNVYIRRGKVKKGVCSVCGVEKVEGHHSDYSKPLEVVWFCRKHHLEYHKSK